MFSTLLVVLAAAAAPAAQDWPSMVGMWVTAATPILVPVIVAKLKRLYGSMPGWFTPLSAVIFGALADVINHFATGQGVGYVWGAALGAAGIGVREIVDQIKNGSSGSTPVAKLIPLLLIPMFAFLGSGCTGVNKYLADPNQDVNKAASALSKLTHKDAVLAGAKAAKATDDMAPYRKDCYDAIADWLPDTGVTVAQLIAQSGVQLPPDGAAGLYLFESLAEDTANGVHVDPLGILKKIIPAKVRGTCPVLRSTARQLAIDLGFIAATHAY